MTRDSLGADELVAHLRRGARAADLDVSEFCVPHVGRAVSGDLTLNYLAWGTQGQPNVLFLHGGGLNAHTWDLSALVLRHNYNVVALDQRGHGDSDWSQVGAYEPADHARDIGHLVDHLGWSTFFLVGMSLGGINSMAYAGSHPERLRGLALVDVGPDLQLEGTEQIQEFMAGPRAISFEEHVANAIRFNHRRDPELLRNSLRHNLRRVDDGEDLWEWKYDPRPLLDVSVKELTQRHKKLWDIVPQIGCPTLVVRGTESNVFHEQDALNLVKELPDGRLVRVQAGHSVQGDNPAELTAMLKLFFESCQFRESLTDGKASS